MWSTLAGCDGGFEWIRNGDIRFWRKENLFKRRGHGPVWELYFARNLKWNYLENIHNSKTNSPPLWPFDEKWTPLVTQNMTNDRQMPARYGMEWEGPALQLPENLLLFRIYSHLITYWIPIFNSWLKSYSSVLTMANECNFTFLFLQELLSLVNGIFLSNILNFIITMST